MVFKSVFNMSQSGFPNLQRCHQRLSTMEGNVNFPLPGFTNYPFNKSNVFSKLFMGNNPTLVGPKAVIARCIACITGYDHEMRSYMHLFLTRSNVINIHVCLSDFVGY